MVLRENKHFIKNMVDVMMLKIPASIVVLIEPFVILLIALVIITIIRYTLFGDSPIIVCSILSMSYGRLVTFELSPLLLSHECKNLTQVTVIVIL